MENNNYNVLPLVDECIITQLRSEQIQVLAAGTESTEAANAWHSCACTALIQNININPKQRALGRPHRVSPAAFAPMSSTSSNATTTPAFIICLELCINSYAGWMGTELGNE